MPPEKESIMVELNVGAPMFCESVVQKGALFTKETTRATIE
jgi:hypothetical protein